MKQEKAGESNRKTHTHTAEQEHHPLAPCASNYYWHGTVLISIAPTISRTVAIVCHFFFIVIIINNDDMEMRCCYQRYLSLLLWGMLLFHAVPTTHSLGFTNIFGVIHHKTDEEAKNLNDFLEEEDYSPQLHLAWFPRRSIQDVVTVVSSDSTSSKKKTPRSETSPTMADQEFIERLIQLQD
jgi:hypothetical protein